MDLIIPNWHPTLVHFTIALFTVAAVLFIVAGFVVAPDIRRRMELVAEWNFWIGLAVTVLTLLAGWRAFNTVAHDAAAHEVMLEHRNLALITAGWALVMAAWLIVRRRVARRPFGPALGVGSLILLALLTVTGWHGGELVYRHGLGVMSLPETGAHGHGGGQEAGGHQHGGGSTTSEGRGGHDHAH